MLQKEIEKPVGPEPQIIYSTCKPAMGYTEILGRNQKWQGPEITTDFLPYKFSQNEDENKQTKTTVTQGLFHLEF